MTGTAELATAASADDPRTGLRAVRALGRLCEHLEGAQVRRARELGWSWQGIAGESTASQVRPEHLFAGLLEATRRAG